MRAGGAGRLIAQRAARRRRACRRWRDPRDAIVVMGEVVGPYGIRGWLRVRTFAESPDALLELRDVVAEAPARGGLERVPATGRAPAFGRAGRGAGGVATREAALAMKGFEVGVPRAALPAAAEGEIYWDDLTGLAVLNRSGVLLGEVAGSSQHGAHPLLRVARPAASPGPERLIPFVRRSSTGSTWTPAGSRWIGARTTSSAWSGGAGCGSTSSRCSRRWSIMRRASASRGARCSAGSGARGVEPARFRDGQAPDRRRPPYGGGPGMVMLAEPLAKRAGGGTDGAA